MKNKAELISKIKSHYIPIDVAAHNTMNHGYSDITNKVIGLNLSEDKYFYYNLDKLSEEELSRFLSWLDWWEQKMTPEEKEIRKQIGHWNFHLIQSSGVLQPIEEDSNDLSYLVTGKRRKFLEFTVKLQDGRNVFIQQDKSYQFTDFLKYNIQ